MHWATQYITCGWKSGATGPDYYDCRSFFRHVQKEHFGRDVPEIGINAEDLRELTAAFKVGVPEVTDKHGWEEVPVPHNGDAVLLGNGPVGQHVGIVLMIDGTIGVLHCARKGGVLFSRIEALPYKRVRFFRHA